MNRLALLLLAIIIVEDARALDPAHQISQYAHSQWNNWSAGNGTEAIAQTPDGWLWIAGPTGAGQFDGERVQPNSWTKNVSRAMASTAFADSNGSIWFGYRLGGVLRMREDELEEFDRDDGIPDGEVHALVQDRRGILWVATDSGIARFDKRRWESIDDWAFAKDGIYGALVARDESLWLATRDGVVQVDASRTVTRLVKNLPANVLRKHFAQTRDGAIWISWPGAGLTRVDRPGPSWFIDKTIGPLLADRHGSLWMGGDALRRLAPAANGFDLEASEANRLLEEYSRQDGLSGDRVTALFEDRFGTLWAATELGFDQFLDSGFTRVTLPEGLRAWGDQTIVHAGGGSVWVAASAGPVLLRYEDDRPTLKLDTPLLTAGTRTPSGEVWFGGPRGVVRIRRGKLQVTPLPEAARGYEVQAMTGDTAGALWVSIHRKGVYRFANERWSLHGGLTGLPRAVALSAATASTGDVWLGYPDGTLARISGGVVTAYSKRDGLDVGAVLSLGSAADRLWIGGDLGIAVFNGSRFTLVRARGCPSIRAISGIGESPAGDLFVHRPAGLDYLHDARPQLDPTQSQQGISCNLHNPDILGGRAQALRPTPTLQIADDGRVWLATSGGPVWLRTSYLRDKESKDQIDVSGRRALSSPTIVSLHWVTPAAGGRLDSGRFIPHDRKMMISDQPSRIIARDDVPKLPAHTREITFYYAMPMQESKGLLRFDVRLRGYFDVWRTLAHDDRAALFTNLGPGKYRFEIRSYVFGETRDNEVKFLEFEILPAYYQTLWFLGVCALILLAGAAVLFRLQLQRAGARLRERLEARLYERERIARELHDTLLQGVQGLIMKIHSASLQMHDREAASSTLNQALDAAQSVLIEGRDRVTSLRDFEDGAGDMAAKIASYGDRLAQDSDIDFSCTVHGERKALHPIVQEEAFLIAREAIQNAFRHANPTRVTADVCFDRDALRVVVSDDGRGVPPDVLASGGRPGHWGMTGMRERAARIRGAFKIGLRDAGGTRVELQVRAAIAYRSHALKLSRLFGRLASANNPGPPQALH